MGPAVFWAHRQPNTHLVPPGVCGLPGRSSQYGTRGSPWAHRQSSTHIWSLLECAAPGRSSQYGTRGFPGLTVNPQHTFGPSWSVRLLAAPRSVGPAVFPGSPPTHNTNCLNSRLNCCSIKHQLIMCARKEIATQVLDPKCQRNTKLCVTTIQLVYKVIPNSPRCQHADALRMWQRKHSQTRAPLNTSMT